MKITRKQLRRLIAEAFKQKVPLFDPVTQGEIDALRQTGRQYADTSSLDASQSAKLAGLAASEPNIERSIYQALGSEEPTTTVEEEEGFLAGQDMMLQDMSNYNLNQALEDIFVNGNKNEAVLRQLGFNKVSDFYHLQPGAEDYENYYKEHFKEQGHLLETMPQDLMFIDTEENDEIWGKITEFIENDERIVAKSISTKYGGGTQAAVSKRKIVALIDYHMGGYGVMTV
jgi:hypothetical protein